MCYRRVCKICRMVVSSGSKRRSASSAKGTWQASLPKGWEGYIRPSGLVPRQSRSAGGSKRTALRRVDKHGLGSEERAAAAGYGERKNTTIN